MEFPEEIVVEFSEGFFFGKVSWEIPGGIPKGTPYQFPLECPELFLFEFNANFTLEYPEEILVEFFE